MEKSELIFEYKHNGFLFQGLLYQGIFRVSKRGFHAVKGHTIFRTIHEAEFNKWKNREIHPVRAA